MIPTSAPLRYATLSLELKQKINDGAFAAGSRLPSVRQLCRDYKASLATVTHALRLLEHEGLIHARERKGFYVQERVSTPFNAATPEPLALEERRRRLLDIAAGGTDCHSLSALSLGEEFIPLALIRRHLERTMREDATALFSGTAIGSHDMHKAVASHARAQGFLLDPDEVVLTHGPVEGLELCLRTLTRPGDTVAVASPGPFRVLDVMAELGLKVLEIPASVETGLSVPALSFAMRHHRIAACVLEPNVSSVTGASMPEEAKRALLELLITHDVALIEYDLLADFYRKPGHLTPVKSLDTDGRILYCAALAPSLGTGMQLGYVAGGRCRSRVKAARKVHGDLIARHLAGAVETLLEDEKLRANARSVRKRLTQQWGELRSLVIEHFPRGTQVSSSTPGHILWVQLPASINAYALQLQAQAQGYTFVAGSAFTLGHHFDHCLRLTQTRQLSAKQIVGIKLIGRLAHAMVDQHLA